MVDSKITAGVLVILAALAGFGGNQLLSQNDFDHVYICNSSLKWGVFMGGVSGSRAYPYVENKTDYKICTKGEWQFLSTYVKSKNMSTADFLAKDELEKQFDSVYECDAKCCWLKE